ncbi:MAG: ChbG/HpnK family deacetylase [bacterium]
MTTRPVRIRITADDLGWSDAVNRGIGTAVAAGTVSAISVLATGPSFERALEVLCEARSISVGLHLDLTDFRCAADPASIATLADPDGRFRRRSRRLVTALLLGAVRREHVDREIRAQLERLRAAGIAPRHLDGHRHAHVFPGLARCVARVARQHALAFVREVPLASPRGVSAGTRAERTALAVLSAIVARRVRLPPTARATALAGLAEGLPLEPDWVAHAVARAAPGLTEIVTHPGDADAGAIARGGSHDRNRDLAALLSPALGAALAAPGIELVRAD